MRRRQTLHVQLADVSQKQGTSLVDGPSPESQLPPQSRGQVRGRTFLIEPVLCPPSLQPLVSPFAPCTGGYRRGTRLGTPSVLIR